MSGNRTEYSVGVILLVVAAVTYSTAGIFTKGVVAGAWAVGVIGAIGTAAFIPAFKLTSIANVSLIYAAAPLIAALLAWLWVGEKITKRTLIGSLCALFGVGVIVTGSLGSENLMGDALALVMTTAMATIMVIYRVYPQTPGAGPSVLQSLFLIPPAFVFGAPFQTAPSEIAILAAFGLLFAIASVTLAEGAKRVPSAQTALLSALETPLATLFAFFIFAEIPATATLIGDAVVLVAVVLSIKDEATPYAVLTEEGTHP